MNEHSNPIDFIIEFAWASGADRFVVNNAKDELKKLRADSADSQRWLSCEKELSDLKQKYTKIIDIFKHPVAYGLVNDRQDLYDLRLIDNPYNPDEKVVPLYSNKKEFLAGDWKGYNQYGKFTK
jgi:hypothetical protein